MERLRTIEQPQPDEDAIHALLQRLGETTGTAWGEFLDIYAPVIYRAISLLESDPDHLSDSFLFVCERLSQDGCRRLRGFRPKGPARFSTWLTVVVRNLYLDWHRHEYGRRRNPQAIRQLTAEEQDVYRLMSEGLTETEALGLLQAQNAQITAGWLERVLAKIGSLLPANFRNEPRFVSLEAPQTLDQQTLTNLILDPAESPEAQAIEKERYGKLRVAVRGLSGRDQLILRLRYEEGLTLKQIARVCGLKDAQSIDRKLQSILDVLRRAL